MPKAILVCGLPVTGKTTYVKEQQKKGYEVIDPTQFFNLNQKLSLNEIIDKAVKKADRRLTVLIRNKDNIIIDGEFATIDDRVRLVRKLKKANYSVACVVFHMPETVEGMKLYLDNVMKANQSITEEDLLSALNYWQHPTTEEGFSAIISYNIYDNKKSA